MIQGPEGARVWLGGDGDVCVPLEFDAMDGMIALPVGRIAAAVRAVTAGAVVGDLSLYVRTSDAQPASDAPDIEPRYLADKRIVFRPNRPDSMVVDGIAVPIPSLQYQLLGYFATHPDMALSRQDLYTGVWGVPSETYRHTQQSSNTTVTASIRRLRASMPEDLADVKTGAIRRVWGVGYKGVTSLNT